MFTVFVFTLIDIVLLFLSFRLLTVYKKNPNPFSFYFMMAVLAVGVGQFINIVMILAFFATGNSYILYLADFVGRIALYASVPFFAQMPLYLLFPKSKKRLWVSYFLAILGVFLFGFFATIPYHPFVGADGIIDWSTPFIITAPFGAILLIFWAAAAGVFVYEFVRSHFKSMRTLMLAIGFILAIFSGITQDYVHTQIEYFLVNLILVLGFVFIFMGILITEKK